MPRYRPTASTGTSCCVTTAIDSDSADSAQARTHTWHEVLGMTAAGIIHAVLLAAARLGVKEAPNLQRGLSNATTILIFLHNSQDVRYDNTLSYTCL